MQINFDYFPVIMFDIFYLSRSDIQYTTNSSKTFLKIPDVKLEDEGLYKCEATYLAVNRECNNVQHIILNVTGKFDSFAIIV